MVVHFIVFYDPNSHRNTFILMLPRVRALLQITKWKKRRACAAVSLPPQGLHYGKPPGCTDCSGNPGKCKLTSRCSGWSTRNYDQGGRCKTGCENIFPVDEKHHRLMGPIMCCSKEPSWIAKPGTVSGGGTMQGGVAGNVRDIKNRAMIMDDR